MFIYKWQIDFSEAVSPQTTRQPLFLKKKTKNKAYNLMILV